MWGIIPAAGLGSRIQPLAFSKELLPVGSRLDGEIERPRAVSEYLVERMIARRRDEDLLRHLAAAKPTSSTTTAPAIGDAASPMSSSRSRRDCATRSSAPRR